MSGYLYHGKEVRYAEGEEFDNLTRKGWFLREDPPTTEQSQYVFWNTDTHEWEIKEKEPIEAQWTSLDFLLRFRFDERSALASAAKNDALINDFRLLCASAGNVRADNPITIQAMSYIVQKEIISKERADQILDPYWNP